MKLSKIFTKYIVLVLFILSFQNYKSQNNIVEYKKIDSLINSGTIMNAMSVIRKLEGELILDSTNSFYWVKYGKASYNMFRYKEAKIAMNKAISKNKNDANAYFEKGCIHNFMNELPDALSSLNKAIELKQEAEYYYWRGIVLQRQEENNLAMKDYESAMSKSFEVTEMYNNYAILLSQKEEYDKALLVINKAIELKPKYAEAYSAKGKIFFYTYQLDSACIYKNKSIALGYTKALDVPDEVCNGTETIKLQYTAEILMQTNVYKQAIKGFNKLFEMHPDSSNYCLNIGFCLYKLKEYADAEKYYTKALELKAPNKKLLYANLELLYFDINNFEKSVEMSTRWIQLDPKDYMAYVERGIALRKLKKYKDAEADFNKSLVIKPDYFRAFGYRSFLFLEQGQYEKAREDSQKSVDINPNYGYGYIVLGQAKEKLGIDGYCIDFMQGKEFNGPDADELLKRFCK